MVLFKNSFACIYHDKSDKKNIFSRFLLVLSLSFSQVNIAGHTRRQIEDAMETKPNEAMFDSAQNQVCGICLH